MNNLTRRAELWGEELSPGLQVSASCLPPGAALRAAGLESWLALLFVSGATLQLSAARSSVPSDRGMMGHEHPKGLALDRRQPRTWDACTVGSWDS